MYCLISFYYCLYQYQRIQYIKKFIIVFTVIFAFIQLAGYPFFSYPFFPFPKSDLKRAISHCGSIVDHRNIRRFTNVGSDDKSAENNFEKHIQKDLKDEDVVGDSNLNSNYFLEESGSLKNPILSKRRKTGSIDSKKELDLSHKSFLPISQALNLDFSSQSCSRPIVPHSPLTRFMHLKKPVPQERAESSLNEKAIKEFSPHFKSESPVGKKTVSSDKGLRCATTISLFENQQKDSNEVLDLSTKSSRTSPSKADYAFQQQPNKSNLSPTKEHCSASPTNKVRMT